MSRTPQLLWARRYNTPGSGAEPRARAWAHRDLHFCCVGAGHSSGSGGLGHLRLRHAPSYRTLMAVARQRLSSPSSLTATARVRVRLWTMTTASTAPSRGSNCEIDPMVKCGRPAFRPVAWRALADSTTRLSRCRYTSSVTQREICSRSLAPARISMTARVRFSMSGAGLGSADVVLGWYPKNSSSTKRGLVPGGLVPGTGVGCVPGVVPSARPFDCALLTPCPDRWIPGSANELFTPVRG